MTRLERRRVGEVGEHDVLAAAASAGVAATVAPFCRTGTVFSTVRFQTVTSCPAASSRADMREPMVPIPRKPTLPTRLSL